MSSVPLKRVGGLGRVAVILVGISAVIPMLTVLVGRSFTDDANTFLAGETSNQDFVEDIAPYLLMSLVQGILMVAAAVIVVIWMFRIVKNHRTLQRGGTWGPGWTIGGWLLPPLLYIIPFLTFREMWKASDPDVPIGAEWRSRPVSPAVTAWFVLYSLVPIALLGVDGGDAVGSFGAGEQQLAEQITGSQTGPILTAVVAIAGAVAFIAMARGLTSRHRRLTGESPS